MKRTQTQARRAWLVSFGLAGHSEHYAPTPGAGYGGCLSGYDRPDNWRPAENADYSGAAVIDKRAPLDSQPSLAISSPMPRADLQPGEINRPFTGTERAPLATAGGWDCVSLADYLTWWRHQGARVGRVTEAGAIEWEARPEPAAPSHVQPEFTL